MTANGESLTYNLSMFTHTLILSVSFKKMIYFRIDGKNVFIKDRKKNILAIVMRFSNGCCEVLTLLLWRSLCADSKILLILVDYRTNCCPKANMVDVKAR